MDTLSSPAVLAAVAVTSPRNLFSWLPGFSPIVWCSDLGVPSRPRALWLPGASLVAAGACSGCALQAQVPGGCVSNSRLELSFQAAHCSSHCEPPVTSAGPTHLFRVSSWGLLLGSSPGRVLPATEPCNSYASSKFYCTIAPGFLLLASHHCCLALKTPC